MLIRLFIIGLVIFMVTTAILYSYRKIAKEHMRHTAKILAAGAITFAVITLIFVLES